MVRELVVIFNPDKISATRLERLVRKHAKDAFDLIETDPDTGGQQAANAAAASGAKRI